MTEFALLCWVRAIKFHQLLFEKKNCGDPMSNLATSRGMWMAKTSRG
jgi:hypothetical protein